MRLYRIKVLGGSEADAQARGWDAHHAPGGFTISAFGGCPAFVGVVVQEHDEIMAERVRGGIAAGAAFAPVLLLSLLAHVPAVLAIAIAAVAAFGAFRFVANHDSMKLEIPSHALTYRSSIRDDGMEPEAAMLRVLRSLRDPSYNGHGETDAALRAAILAASPAAERRLDALAVLRAEAKALKTSPSWAAE